MSAIVLGHSLGVFGFQSVLEILQTIGLAETGACANGGLVFLLHEIILICF